MTTKEIPETTDEQLEKMLEHRPSILESAPGHQQWMYDAIILILRKLVKK